MGAWDEFIAKTGAEFGKEPEASDMSVLNVDADLPTPLPHTTPVAEYEKRTSPTRQFLQEPQEGGAWEKFRQLSDERANTQPEEKAFSFTDASLNFIKGVLQGVNMASPEELLGIENLSTMFASPGARRLMKETEKRFEPEGIAGDIGEFVGTTAKYILMAKLLGFTSVFQTTTLLTHAAQAGVTGALVRMFKPNRDGKTEDVIDRVQNSLDQGAYGYALVGAIGGLGKAWIHFRGGESKYIQRIGQVLHRSLINKYKLTPDQADDALGLFNDAIRKQGGVKSLQRSAISRAKDAAGNIKRLNGLRTHVRIRAFKELGLNDEQYRKFNVGMTGKASTKEMNARELGDLKRFYRAMFKDGRGKPTQADMSDMMKRFDPEKHYVPGSIAQVRGVEAVMTEAGYGQDYYKVYNADVNWKVKANIGTKVLKKLGKGVSPMERERLFNFISSVETSQFATRTQIRKAFYDAGTTQGMSEKFINHAIIVRKMTSDRLNEITRMKIKMFRDLGLDPKLLERELPKWNMAYQPNIYKRLLSARGGLSAAEFNALKRSARKGTVIDRFLFDRQPVSSEQLDLLIKDPYLVTDIANKAALRTVHLEPVTRGFMNKMSSPSSQVPRLTRQYIADWMDFGVLGKLTPNDVKFNQTFKFSGRVAAANLKAMSYSGTMFANPATLVKQLLQQELNVAELGKHWLKGVHSIVSSGSRNPMLSELTFKNASKDIVRTGMSGWEFAAKNSQLFRSRQFGVLEGLNPSNFGRVMNGLIKVGLYPFKLLDSTNIVAGFNGGVAKYLREGKPMATAIRLADALVRKTQYNYLNIETPLAMHGAGGKLAYQFMSWPVHYAELIWSWGGKMNYDGTTAPGRVSTHAVNILKSKQFARYFAINASLIAALNMAGVDFGLKKLIEGTTGLSLLPGGIPPSLNLMISLGKTSLASAKLISGDDYFARRMQSEGLRGIQRQLGVHTIPMFSTLRKVYKITQPGLLPKDAEKFFRLRKRLPWRSLVLPVSSREYQKMSNDLGL